MILASRTKGKTTWAKLKGKKEKDKINAKHSVNRKCSLCVAMWILDYRTHLHTCIHE